MINNFQGCLDISGNRRKIFDILNYWKYLSFRIKAIKERKIEKKKEKKKKEGKKEKKKKRMKERKKKRKKES